VVRGPRELTASASEFVGLLEVPLEKVEAPGARRALFQKECVSAAV